MRLTFSTPGTWTAWMPASPCVSRLQGSSSSVTAGTDQKYELRKASTGGILPGAKSDAENPVVCGVHVYESASNHLREETRPLGETVFFFREEAFVHCDVWSNITEFAEEETRSDSSYLPGRLPHLTLN